MKMPSPLVTRFGIFLGLLAPAVLFAAPAFAESDGGPHVQEERLSLEGLPILLVIFALIIAVGLAYVIGRRSRK